jgi:galactokinase
MTMADARAQSDAEPRCLDTLKDRTVGDFRKRFGRDPEFLVAAPGRVNLIGEHIDYNDGYVLPMAIERYVVMVGAKATNGHAEVANGLAAIYSADKNDVAALRLAAPIVPTEVKWSSYVQGVVAGFVARGMSPPPFDAVIRSTVPLGGGLSSSAALEMATATFLESILGLALSGVDKALLCQEAEHKFAGVPCGIMDQFSSALCTKDHLMLLDCRSQEVELVPFESGDITVLIANSNVKHELTGGEYAKRRAECEAAAKSLGVPSLRDATAAQLELARGQLDDIIYRRARHVISEIDRTRRAADAIRGGRWNEVGKLMYASHASLRDDYEVSCEELDLLVDLARQIGPAGGVIGSRMTGGGFGGCTVSLVRTEAANHIEKTLHDQYQAKTGIEPTLFTSRPAQGARALVLNAN